MADDTGEMVAIMALSGFMIMTGAAFELNRRNRNKRSRWGLPQNLTRPVRGTCNTFFNELMNRYRHLYFFSNFSP